MSTACATSAPRFAPERFGVAATAVGVHVGLWLAAGPVGIYVTIVETALATTVILTALYASPHFSDRAFRMLPWAGQTDARWKSQP